MMRRLRSRLARRRHPSVVTISIDGKITSVEPSATGYIVTVKP